MSYKNIVFIKLEKRLLNDHRWYIMSDSAQLIYIKLILLAAETYNKIPKNDNVLREALRSRLDLSEFTKCMQEIKENFPKLRENKHFMYFDEFEYKTNYIPKKEILRKSSGHPQHSVEEEEDKKKNKSKEDRYIIPPTYEMVSKYCLEQKNGINPQRFIDHYTASDWMRNKAKIKDWQACVRTWEQNSTPKKQSMNIL